MNQLPYNLNDITLSKWVEWQNAYGQKLDDRFAEIMKLDGEQKRNARLLHQFDEYCQKYAFYTGVPLSKIMKMQTEEVLPIIKAVGQSEIALKKHEATLNQYAAFFWAGDYWKVQPVLPHVAHFTKEQFEINQDIALIFSDLQDGRHEALYELCGSFLRNIGEPYSEDLMLSRVELMKELPLSISLCVRKFIDTAIRKLLKQ